MKRSKMNASTLQAQSIPALKKEAARLKSEFESYLEDLQLFTKPGFWKAVEEVQRGKGKKFTSVQAMINDLDR